MYFIVNKLASSNKLKYFNHLNIIDKFSELIIFFNYMYINHTFKVFILIRNYNLQIISNFILFVKNNLKIVLFHLQNHLFNKIENILL